ncbi:MAG TPA: glycoside hydrolase family 99-like domain-containing protein, partial [Candidatus Sulfotelmatobacter sp.]|nr:glycoside hydrolase family 99-like domain-containing protein [Candidatus Sulfotelmatobacter sp.]
MASPGNGLILTLPNSGSYLLSPPLPIQADRQNYVSLRLAAEQGERLTLLYATEATHGWHSLTFPVQADGQDHTYTLDVQPEDHWRGKVIALALAPGDASGAKVRLRQLSVSDEPQGEPQLKLTAFTLEDTLPRAGRPATLTAVIANTGGSTATNLQALLTLPQNVRRLSSSPAETRVRELAFGETLTWHWQIECAQPLEAAAQVRLVADNSQPVVGQTPLHFTVQPNLPKADYVPEPKPVRGSAEVGVYYFPGWNSVDRWQKIQPFPERKPTLGWYREGDPEVADWHIKWAVEHGITYFAYDWYWSKGARHLEHGLHDGYFKARYRHLLKFSLLWANHNPPQTSSPEDCLAVTRFWITNYFQRSEYLTMDGKPVVIIFSPYRLTEDLGHGGVKPALEAMRAECRKAGLKGLYLLACVSSASEAQQVGAEGYDAVTAYNWPGLGRSGTGNYAPFSTLVEGYRQNWERILEKTPVPLLLPICGGWDSRPWHGDKNLVRFGRTPELFKRHLLDAKNLLQAPPSKSVLPNHILIEAWNEWGEGSYIEPHSQFGFGYLDAIRDVFTAAPPAHSDIVPADVGLGPYDLPPAEPPRTTWDFDQGNQGWNSTMQLRAVSATNGVLTGLSTGTDPAFFGP